MLNGFCAQECHDVCMMAEFEVFVKGYIFGPRYYNTTTAKNVPVNLDLRVNPPDNLGSVVRECAGESSITCSGNFYLTLISTY